VNRRPDPDLVNDLVKVKKASGIWSNRLTDACGGRRAFDQKALDPYIKPVGGN